MMERPYTVVYDGTCRVCERIANVVRPWGANIVEVIPSQTPGIQARFPWITPAQYAESMQLIGPGGVSWEGAAAIEQLLAVLPRGRLIGWIFHIPLVRRIADRVYRWFARNRYRLGCSQHCRISN